MGNILESINTYLKQSKQSTLVILSSEVIRRWAGRGTRVIKNSHEVSGLPIWLPAPVLGPSIPSLEVFYLRSS